MALTSQRVTVSRSRVTPKVAVLTQWCEDQYVLGRSWRWNYCAPENLKKAMGLWRPDPAHQILPHVHFAVDTRLFHILWDTKATEVQLLSRPWVSSAMDDGFPVEFRVFHTPDGQAACNY